MALAALAFAPAAGASDSTSLGRVGDFKYVQAKVHLANAGPAEEKAKDVAPRCGHGWAVSGGGGFTGGAASQAFLSTTGNGGTRKWFVSAWHVDEQRVPLTGMATCVRNMSLVQDGDLFSVGAAPGDEGDNFSCLSGQAIAGGVRAIGATTDWFVNSSYPIDGGDPDSIHDDGWQIYLRHRSGGASSFIVDVTCGVSVSPAYAEDQELIESGDSETGHVKCASGHVTGGGALISGTVANAHIGGSFPVDGNDADKVPDDGWKVRATNDTGSDKNLTTYAICV